MAVSLQEVVRGMLRVGLAVLCLPPLVMHAQQRPSAASGFKTDPRLAEIIALINAEKYQQARDAAAQLIGRSSSSFKSPKYEQFIKAQAHFMAGDAARRMQDRNGAIAEFRQAAEMGDAEAYAAIAANLTSRVAHSDSADERGPLIDEALSSYEACADLGNTICMEMLANTYNALHRTGEELYWRLLQRMNETPQEVADRYQQQLDEQQRKNLTALIQLRSPSGGAVESKIATLPGRSTLTAIFVDTMMRRQLEFVWRAFYSSVGPERTMYQSFSDYREHVPPNPFSSTYLLVAQPPGLKDASVMNVKSAANLTSNLLNGDSIIVRCGPTTHEAVVWDVSHGDYIMILDPFAEFWLPSQNACVSHVKTVHFRYKRDFLQVPTADIQGMIQGVITVRDNPKPGPSK